MMAYRLAAERSDKIAAIGVSSGQMLIKDISPEFPVPIMHFHGLSDPKAPYEGRGDSTEVFPPVDSVMAIWRNINNCNATPDTIYNENDVVAQKWASPGGISDIILYTYTEGEHDWPRPANWGLSATDIIWDFLTLQTKSSITNIEVEDSRSFPQTFELFQNYPNPFNPVTRIKYKLPKSSHIELKIYNLAGQEIETLINEFQSAGKYEITWQPKRLPSGLYFYKLHAGKFSETRKLILLK